MHAMRELLAQQKLLKEKKRNRPWPTRPTTVFAHIAKDWRMWGAIEWRTGHRRSDANLLKKKKKRREKAATSTVFASATDFDADADEHQRSHRLLH